MKTNEKIELVEDRELAEAVRQAFDLGDVPARLSSAVHAAAGREWLEGRRRSRQRMHRWLSGLTSMAAAMVILMYSATGYFGSATSRNGDEKYRNLNEIMDLVTLSYPDEDLTDEELLALELPSRADITRDYVAARLDNLLATDGDYFGE